MEIKNTNYTRSNSYPNGFNGNNSISDLKKSSSHNNIEKLSKDARVLEKKVKNCFDIVYEGQLAGESEDDFYLRSNKNSKELSDYKVKLDNIYMKLAKERGSLDDLLKAKEVVGDELSKAVYCKKIINLSNKQKLEDSNINIEELESYFKSTTGYKNEDEKLLLESCVDGRLKISDNKLYHNWEEIELKNIRDNIIETAFKLCCLADNSDLVRMLFEDKNVLNIKNILLNYSTTGENPFLSYIMCRICINNCLNTLKVFINDDYVVKSLLEYRNLGIIKWCLNQGGSANNHKMIKLLLDNKEILNNAIVSDRITNGFTCTKNNLNRDITCFVNNCVETCKSYLDNYLVRKTMIEKKNKEDFGHLKKGESYIVGQYRAALTLGYLEIVKLILNYNDIMEHIVNYDREILLQTLEEAYKQEDLELIEKLGKYDKDGKQHLIDALKNSKLEIVEALIKSNINFKEDDDEFIFFDLKNKKAFDTIKNNFNKICKKYNIKYNNKDLFYQSSDELNCQYYIVNLEEIGKVSDKIRIKIEEDNNREYCKNLRKKISEYDDKINLNLNKIEKINDIINNGNFNSEEERRLLIEEKNKIKKENAEYEFEKKSLFKLLAENVNYIDDIYEFCLNGLSSIDDENKLKCLLKVLYIEPENNKEKAKKEEIKSEISKLQTKLFKVQIIDESGIRFLNNCIIGDLNNFETNYNEIKFNIASLLIKGFKLACACGNLNIVEYILEDENLKNIIVNNDDENYYYDIFLRVIKKGETSIFRRIITCDEIRQKLVNRQKRTLGNDGPIYYWYSILSNNSDKITDEEYGIEELSLFFSYPETIELIKNNTNFMARCIPYFARNNYPFEIIKQIFNDSLVSEINNFSILGILQEIVTCKRLDIVELILDFEQFKSFSIGLKIELMEESINLAFEQKNFELIKKILRANLVPNNAIIETFKTAFEQDNLELIGYMLFENDKTRKLILDENILVRYSEDMLKNGQINSVLEYLISHDDSEIAKEVCNIDKLLECFKVACEKGHLYVVKELIKNENIRKILSDRIIDLYDLAFNNELYNIAIEIFNCEKDNIIEKDQNGNVLKKHLSILLSKNQINEFIKLFEEQNIKEKIVNDREFFNMVFANILYTGNIEFLKKILKNLDPKNTTERQLIVYCFYFFCTCDNSTILFNEILNEDDVRGKFEESNAIGECYTEILEEIVKQKNDNKLFALKKLLENEYTKGYSIDKNTIEMLKQEEYKNGAKSTLFYKVLTGNDFDLVDGLARKGITFGGAMDYSVFVENESDFKNIKDNIEKLFNRYNISYNETEIFCEFNYNVNLVEVGKGLIKIKDSVNNCIKFRKKIDECQSKIEINLNKMIEIGDKINYSNKEKLENEKYNLSIDNTKIQFETDTLLDSLMANTFSINDIYEIFFNNKTLTVNNEYKKLKHLIKVLNIESIDYEEKTKKDRIVDEILKIQKKLYGEPLDNRERNFLNSCVSGELNDFMNFYKKNKHKNGINHIFIKGFELACIYGNSNIVKNCFENDDLKNIIVNENNNYDFFKEVVVEKNDSVLKILVDDDDFRKKLIETQKKQKVDSNGLIYNCFNELAAISESKRDEQIVEILFSHLDVVESIINLECFKRDCKNFIKYYPIKIIELFFNSSTIPSMNKEDILVLFEHGFICGCSDFIELLLNCKRIKSTEDGNYIIKETLKSAYEEFYEKNNPILLKNLMSYNNGEIKNIIVKNGILSDYVKDLFKDGKTYALDYFLDRKSGFSEKEVFKNGTLSDCLKIACEKGQKNILQYSLNKLSESLNEVCKFNNILSECFEIACKNGKIDVLRYLITNEKIKNKITQGSIIEGFKIACKNGYLDVIKELISNFNTKYTISYYDKICECCNLTLSSGHDEIAIEMFNDSKIRENIIKNDNDGKLLSYYALRFCSNDNFDKFKELFEDEETREKIINNKDSFDMIMINICDTDNIELLKIIFKNIDKNEYPEIIEKYLQKCSINTFNLLLGDKDISSKIDISTLYSKLKEASDNEKIEELLKSDMSEIVVNKIKNDNIGSFTRMKHEVLKIAFVKGDYELVELLIKNGINFTGPIQFNAENELDKLYEFKKHFKYIANKYGFYFNDSIFVYNNENLIKIQNIINGIKEKIENKEELFEFIINKNHSESSSVNIDDNSIEQKINKLNDISEKLANYNINKDSKFVEYCLPEIRDNNNTIVEGGFGGTTTFKKRLFNSRTVEITFEKNGFLRKTLEDNNVVDDEILDIFKGSLVIEQGVKWKNSNKYKLDAILMFFKKDPFVAFKMLLSLEQEGVIKLKKKKKGKFSLLRKLKNNEKRGILQSFSFTVKVRKQLASMVEFKNNIIESNGLLDNTRNDIRKILDFGINILYKMNNIRISNENDGIINQKNDIIDNIDKLFEFTVKKYQRSFSHNVENINEEFHNNDRVKKDNNDKFTGILEIINKESELDNCSSLLDDLNSCIDIIESGDVNNSCSVQ